MKTLPSRLIKGTPLIGFMDAFDDTSGSGSETPWPYKVVIPSAVGPALLPFPCPHCARIASELVDPNKREHYYDPLRKFSWCPGCQKRFFVDRKGRPLDKALPVGATSAPAVIEERNEVGWGGEVSLHGGERQEIRGWRRPYAIPGHRRFMLGGEVFSKFVEDPQHPGYGPMGIRDGRGYGPYGKGYYNLVKADGSRTGNLPLGPNMEMLPTRQYDFQPGPDGLFFRSREAPLKLAPGVTMCDEMGNWSRGEIVPLSHCVVTDDRFAMLGAIPL